MKARESSSKESSEDAPASTRSSPTKSSKKENYFLDALEAIRVDDNEANDAHSVGSVGNNAKVNQKAMQSITAVSNMKNSSEMKRYLTQVIDAMNSVTDSNSLPVKNLTSKFTDQDLKDLRLEASVKIDLDVCSVDEYLEFLKGLNAEWHSRSNDENEISSLVNSCSFGNLLSTNMKEETSKNYTVFITINDLFMLS